MATLIFRRDLSQSDGERGTIDTPRLALYTSDDLGSFALDGTISYGYDQIATTRPITALGETASSDHDGHEANAALQARTRLVAGGVTITPAAGLQYTHLFETDSPRVARATSIFPPTSVIRIRCGRSSVPALRSHSPPSTAGYSRRRLISFIATRSPTHRPRSLPSAVAASPSTALRRHATRSPSAAASTPR